MRAGVAVLLACTAAGAATAQQPVAFVDISVVPMDSNRVVAGQTVVVTGGRIAAIGPSATTVVPAGTRVIDGRGRWLVPGLADMHVHLLRDSLELLLYLASGVTTVRELAGEPLYLHWRTELETGARSGPRLYVASPLLDAPAGLRFAVWTWGGAIGFALMLAAAAWLGRSVVPSRPARRLLPPLVTVAGAAAGFLLMREIVPVPDALFGEGRLRHVWVATPLEARREVRAAAGSYDAVKLYGGLSPRQFAAATREAREDRIHTVAHVPPGIGLDLAYRSGLDEVAHAYFYVLDLQRYVTTTGASRDSAFRDRLAFLADEAHRAGVAVTTTLAPLPELRERLTDSAAAMARPELRYRSAEGRRRVQEYARQSGRDRLLGELELHIPWSDSAVAALHRAGVALILGTDASPLSVVAGFSAHAELARLVACGLTPYQALRTATVNAAAAAGASAEWGTIATGKRADLIVSDRNPLQDVGALQSPRGVMRSGRYYERSGLDSLLAAAERLRSGG